MHILKLQPGSRQLERRHVVVDWLGRRTIEHLEQDVNSHQSRRKVEVEPCQALGWLTGKNEGGDKGGKLARCRAGQDHAVAAIDDGDRDRDPSNGFHERARAASHTRHLVRLRLDVGNVVLETPARHILQREGLHDADALQHFLQRLHGACAAGELAACDRADAVDESTKHQQSGRKHDEADQEE